MSDTCVCCGEIIPEGYWVCLRCVRTITYQDTILQDGVVLNMKSPIKPYWPQLQSRTALNKQKSTEERKQKSW